MASAPLSLPAGWQQHLDPSSGAVYFHHAASHTSQWEPPHHPHPHSHTHPYSHTQQYSQQPSYPHSHSHSGISHTQSNEQASSHALDQLFEEDYTKHTLPPLTHTHTHHTQQQYQHHTQPSHHTHTHTHTQLPVESAPPKRTTVKIKSKKLSEVLSKSKNKVYVAEDTTPLEHHSTDIHSVDASTSTKGVSDKYSESDPPVGGKSQDYLGLVKIYNLQRPFLDRAHSIPCVLCQRVVPEDIFFPCEHKVVCRGCIQREQVCPDYDLVKFPNGHCNCPLCATIIKLILPNEHGKEVEKYWDWVLAVKPELPQGFMRDFRHSAAIIKKIHIDENVAQRKKKKRPKTLQCCCVS